uniref:Uncharacterized protein n=1 Tax=Pristhesancus plagipennis TaxID=1955184 RepID=A0A2K8JWM2_PRIPG|nr:secreted hypothetical protein [Pristhesancus plagipennis]
MFSFLLLTLLVFYSQLLTFSSAIDNNEKLGFCMHNIDINVNDHVTAYEGVWFPQYRTRDSDNHRYSCHTLYERVYYEARPKLIFDSYYTVDGIAETESHEESYSPGEKRGITVDDEGFLEGYGSYNVFNYILKLTPEYRVRYLCTDYVDARRNKTMVYIETRNMRPKLETIKEAVNVLRKHKLYVHLDRIEQRNCKRPLGPDGYQPLDKEPKSITRDNH